LKACKSLRTLAVSHSGNRSEACRQFIGFFIARYCFRIDFNSERQLSRKYSGAFGVLLSSVISLISELCQRTGTGYQG
ncbi:hypothetical protein, partial [Pseudomonas syringae]|uniref:hypothetical protein n=1 Tax=Pseudomonas syringae TaxID=317 RepID=UPI001E295E69